MGTIKQMESRQLDFFPNVDSEQSLSTIRYFQDWTIEATKKDLGGFFQSLAVALKQAFDAQLVTIWDNNHFGDCLVLQASIPERRSILASHTVPSTSSLTGLAVEHQKIVHHPNIRSSNSQRQFANPEIIEELDLHSMISIPVSRPESNTVSLVINICFDSRHSVQSPITLEDTNRLLARLGTALQYHIYKRDERINQRVQSLAATATGAASLFDGITADIQILTTASRAALFKWDGQERRLKLERVFDRFARTTGHPVEIEMFREHYAAIESICLAQGKPLVVRRNENVNEDAESYLTVKFIAVPIVSSTNDVVGAVACGEPTGQGKPGSSFSSLDLHALETFSRAIAAPVERFFSLKLDKGVMQLVNVVSHAMLTAKSLDECLQRAIESLVDLLHSEVGSVYLREGYSDVFRMRAAKGSNEKLIGKATYRVDEGITGAVAKGQVLTFKSLAEMRKYPTYQGKYDADIWGNEPDHESETFLGVPIRWGNSVIGVWKISNISATDEHPDPYYTDEDIQAALVLSSLAAYAIQIYQLKDANLRQFKWLAQTVQIQESNDEDEAIFSAMVALEDAGYQGALLSLCDNQTKQIVPRQSSGRTWKTMGPPVDFNGNDIRSAVLAESKMMFGPIDESLQTFGHFQAVLPLSLPQEMIGTLQIDIGRTQDLSPDEQLILQAFSSHLSIAISRSRNMEQIVKLTNQILSSSRFITAETLSGMAVHSLHHKLQDMTVQLKKDLDRQEIRQNPFLKKNLDDWNKKLVELEKELKKILKFVRAPSDYRPTIYELNPEIQVCINTWFNYLRNQKCTIQPKLEASYSSCRVSPEVFREIIAVLIVNAVQAHAKEIVLRTYNQTDVETATGDAIHNAFCLSCSDNGIGLATSEVEQIFEATYSTKEALGTGLGLFVARRLARASGGDLEVIPNGAFSKGAAFRLTLPIAEKKNVS